MITFNGRPGEEAAVGVGVAADRTSVLLTADQRSGVSPCLAAALSYAEAGVHVFPLTLRKKPVRRCATCLSPGACPGRNECRCGVDTCHGFYAATVEPTTIRRWWSEHPQWQVGLRTGALSNLVVLDVDVDNGGLDSLVALQRADLDIAGTAVQLSGSGRSFHLVYAHPGHPVASSQARLGPGLDVRGDGGYVVGAPSVHASTGARYQLLGDLQDVPVWPLPAWRDQRRARFSESGGPRRGTSAHGRGAVDGGRLSAARLAALVAKVAGAPVGQRRSTLFWAACRVGECSGRQDYLVSAAGALMLAAQRSGLDSSEIFPTLLEGLRLGRRS